MNIQQNSYFYNQQVEKVVQQSISAMQYQDQQYANLQQQKSYQSVSQQDLYNKAESRYYQAQQKIKTSGVQQRQLTPENYPEGVKKLLGTYYLIITAPPQYKNQLQNEFKETILKLRQQKSGLSLSCLIDFCSNLFNNQIQNELNKWINYISGESLYDIKFQFVIRLDGNDQKQFANLHHNLKELPKIMDKKETQLKQYNQCYNMLQA